MADLLPEIYIDTRGEAGIDNLEEWTEAFPRLARRAINSALSTEGLRLRKEMQAAITAGGPRSRPWEKLYSWYGRIAKAQHGYRYKKKFMRGDVEPESNRSPLLKLKGGIRYHVNKQTNLLSIGFIDSKTGSKMSAKVIQLLGLQATGFETPITEKLRRFWFALGLGLKKSTTRLKAPARPLVGPVFTEQRSEITFNLQRNFFANLERYQKEGAR